MINHPVKIQVFVSGEPFIKAGILENNADGAPDLVRLIQDVKPVYNRLSAARHQQSAEDIYGRSLTGTVGAQESEDLAFFHLKRNIVDGGNRSEMFR